MPQLTTPQPSRHPTPTARATSLAYVVFERPDLERAEAFLSDFGLRLAYRTRDVLYMRATAPSPFCYRVHQGPRARFVGAGFHVATRAELEHLAGVEGASPIEHSVHPGGGERVRLRDPSGFTVEVVRGQAGAEEIAARDPLPLNLGGARARINRGQRPPAEPPQVTRLGHLVLEVVDFQATCAWYGRHLGFIPSDVQVLPDGSPAVAFLRLDLGATPADHHTLAIGQGFRARHSHTAFEVVDADAVGMGQRILQERGWRHAWGIGRHVLGSQIFDYWEDPWGEKHERYCDGDLFTADHPLGVHAVSREAMSQWGQPMPRSFTRPHFTPAEMLAALRSVRRGPDLTLRKLIALARVFG